MTRRMISSCQPRRASSSATIVAMLLLLLLLQLSSLVEASAPASGAPEEEFVVGQKVHKVVKLNEKLFHMALQDPANPIFLYMFSAHWCGHCKRLTPVLEATAPQVVGRLAIGKIDCTESDSKKLCNEFQVRGYPTLKFSIHGEMYDYTLGRSEKDFVNFAERLSRPPMAIVDTIDRAQHHAMEETFGHGVAFLCHDPLVAAPEPGSITTVEDMASKSTLLQACQHVAQKEMLHAHFVALTTKVDTSSITGIPPEKPSDNEEESVVAPTEGGFVCRIEANVPSRCLLERDTKLDVDTLHEFVKVQNVATVTDLGSQNFNRIAHLGRPLVIGVVDPSDEEATTKIKNDLRSYAINAPAKSASERYYFGYMDGVRWAKYLQQYNITETPQIFVLNVPKRLYWQDASYYNKGKALEEFLAAVDNGTIEAKESGGVGGAGFLVRIANGFWSWMPLSLLLVLAIGLAIVIVVMDIFPIGKSNKNTRSASGGAGVGAASQQSQPVDTMLGKKQQ